MAAGAQDVVSNDDGSIDGLTDPAEFSRVKAAMIAAQLLPEQAEVTMRPGTSATLDAEAAASMVKLLDVLEDLDDVQQVYSNADIAEEILAQL